MADINGSFGGGLIGNTSAAIGTVFYAKVPPRSGAYTVISKVRQTNGNTANISKLMRPIGRTTASAAATTSGNTITLTADPGPTGNGIAANDIVVTQNADGTTSQYVVGAWNGTSKVVTLTAAALAVNVSSGAKVWNYGIHSDTDPVTGAAHPQIDTPAVNTSGDAFLASNAGFRSAQVFEPLLVYNPNATGQTSINYVEYCYSKYA